MKRLNYFLGLGAMLIMASLQAQADHHAMADGNKIYGDFRVSMMNNEVGSADGIVSFDNNASRLGFKGKKTDGKMTVKYAIETALNNDGAAVDAFATRYMYAGLGYEGAGMLKFGQMSTPYKLAGQNLDPFYDTSAGTTTTGANFGLSGYTNGFAVNSLHYYSCLLYTSPSPRDPE